MDEVCIIIVCVLLGYILGWGVAINSYDDNKPSAMDVYQGKTTIEYKVVDGEVIDSCVIWKKNE